MNLFDLNKIIKLGISILVLIVSLIVIINLFENLDANELMVIQSPTGSLTWHIDPGIKWQGWGKITTYPRRMTVKFQSNVTFSDKAKAVAHGTVLVVLPLDEKHLNAIHKDYHSAAALDGNLLQTVVTKSIVAAAPLMSSEEAAAGAKNDLIRYVEDEIQHGTYRTAKKEIQIVDPIDNQKKTRTVTEVVTDSSGQIARQELSPIIEYGVKAFNVTISDLVFDDTVTKQIANQQALTQQVQTAIAEAKKAQQAAITAAANGEAEAAKAKWEQEVIKAKAVTQAEQQRDVAKLDKEAAEFTRQKLILEGQGEAEKRRLIMTADGALTQKLEAWKEVNKHYALAIEKSNHPLTPSVIMGHSGGSNNVGMSLMDMLMVKTAKDLGLDNKINKE